MNLPRPFGPYELVRQLAVGGMAEVFVARARSVAGFEKVVALKMIHPRFSADPEFARLLVEEANITAQLSHRNIVQVIDLGQTDGVHYIAMEYVDGPDLSRVLTHLRNTGRKCSPRVAAFVLREVCDGLDHAHRKAGSDGRPLRIVHRDVSPPNILVSSSGEVKLTDFGIAKAALRASSTEAGVVKGKYGYMSPEQSRGEVVDARADIFSAGCVLYELLTGRPVYPELPLPVLLTRVAKGQFEPAEKLRPDLPPALGAVLRRALAAKPEARFATARAMADELNGFLYTLPPGPEAELLSLVDALLDEGGGGAAAQVGASAFDPDLDDSTQIETMASLRRKMELVGAADGAESLMSPAATGAKSVPPARSTGEDEFPDVPTRAQGRRRTNSVMPPVSEHRPSTRAPGLAGRGEFPDDEEESTRAGRPLAARRASSPGMPAPSLPPPVPVSQRTTARPPTRSGAMSPASAAPRTPSDPRAGEPLIDPFGPTASVHSDENGHRVVSLRDGASGALAAPQSASTTQGIAPVKVGATGLFAPQYRPVLLASGFAALGVLVLVAVLVFGR